jgi:hypothetical protein
MNAREKWDQLGETYRQEVLEELRLPVGYCVWKWEELPAYLRYTLVKHGAERRRSKSGKPGS